MRKRTSEPTDFGRVAVLMGGWSSERQVSLWSGEQVLKALQAQGIDAHEVDASPRGLLHFDELGFDRVFNILHGTAGEDGTVQAVLDLHGIPYTGCGVLASALAMDKLRSKRIWRAEGLPTPDYALVRSAEELAASAEKLGYPLFVKPASDGSSVGVVKLKSVDQCKSAFAAAGKGGQPVMAEVGIVGDEYTCAILDGEALPLIRIEPQGEFYDYDAKYLSDATRYHCPCGLDPAHEMRLRELCVKAFNLLGCHGWGRVDFMLDASGEPLLLEINTQPGMTTHSLVPKAAAAVGISFEQLCWTILETSLEYAE